MKNKKTNEIFIYVSLFVLFCLALFLIIDMVQDVNGQVEKCDNYCEKKGMMWSSAIDYCVCIDENGNEKYYDILN